jgi:DNA-binding beta-propeller fold protein YncE
MDKKILFIIIPLSLFFIVIALGSFREIPEEKQEKENNGLSYQEEEEKREENNIIQLEEEEEGREEDNNNRLIIANKDLAGQIVEYQFTISGVPSPKGIAFSPDGEEIWVTSLTNKQTGVYVFDSLTGKEKERIQLPDGGGVEVIFNHDGTRAYVSQMETARVFEIDSLKKEIVRVFETKSSWTKVLFLSADGNKLYASNWVDDNVSVFNLNTGELLDNLPSPDTPRGIYVTKDNKTLYVAGFGEGALQEINLVTGESKIVYESGGALRHIVGDEGRGFLFISDMARNKIWQFDIENKKTTIFAETDVNPNTIALSPDKNILFVSNRGENYSLTDYSRPGPEWGSILLFDVNTGLLLDAILGGNQPTGLDISPDGRRLVFSNFLDHNLEIYQIPDYSVLAAGNGGAGNSYKASLRK